MAAILKNKLQSFSSSERMRIPLNSDKPSKQAESTSSSTDFSRGNAEASAVRPEIGEDILAEARKVIGLCPVKPSHILKWNKNEYSPCEDDIPTLEEERRQAALTFLQLKLKYKGKDPIQTKWSANSNTLWVTFDSEVIVNSLFMA